jgi:alkanesulfonate monooxygenase SsuD/methylene tetrahydromethanopterin reductase-like flavin-dependent oxidoreductase (luciferase family)
MDDESFAKHHLPFSYVWIKLYPHGVLGNVHMEGIFPFLDELVTATAAAAATPSKHVGSAIIEDFLPPYHVFKFIVFEDFMHFLICYLGK